MDWITTAVMENRMPVESLIEQAIAQIPVLEPRQAFESLDRYLLVDVREPNEVLQGFLPGAINVPRGVLEFRAADDARFRPLDRPILLYSNSGRRSALAARCLKELGYTGVAILRDGIDAWAALGLPVE